MPQCTHGLSEYGLSREHLPHSMRLAHAPRVSVRVRVRVRVG